MTPLDSLVDVPAVAERDAGSDRLWFADHSYRRYRLRRTNRDWWLVRRRAKGVMLRARAGAIPRGLPDADRALRAIWVAAAWACLDPIEQGALVKQIKQGERLNEL